ncbi:MAG: sulfotransferase [Flavobacteriales bacterium]|nr:sulfotransferase [Flavobacteriales bacterium]
MAYLADKDFIFVVGAPRSGTTWLHQMLLEHPDVAGLESELTVFYYLGLLDKRYADEKYRLDNGHWRQGAPLLYTEEEFRESMRQMALDAYGRVLARKPEATHILDKHPGYAVQLPLINKLFPRCKVIHIIRDGREVVVSMMNTKRKVGFGAGEIKGATAEWFRNIREARANSKEFGPDRYMEVRYEELVAHTQAGLKDLFRFVGLDAPDPIAARIAAANDISVKQVSWGNKELNDLRDKPKAIWQTKLSLEERWVMDRMAGDLLKELGYWTPGWWALSSWDPLRIKLHFARKRILNTLGSAKHTWKTPMAKRLSGL